MSPRTIAVMRRPSPSTKNAAFAVSSGLIPRKAARLAIVVVPGVATSSRGSGVAIGGSETRTFATWRLAAIAARLAQHEDVLADGVEDHELVGLAAAHHPDVGGDGDRLAGPRRSKIRV